MGLGVILTPNSFQLHQQSQDVHEGHWFFGVGCAPVVCLIKVTVPFDCQSLALHTSSAKRVMRDAQRSSVLVMIISCVSPMDLELHPYDKRDTREVQVHKVPTT